MPFVKLDCAILNSTLWIDPVERDIFITALLMAVPFEFKIPQAQIAVNEIRETGFIAPPGWYGKVEAAGPGIVRRALIDQEPGLRALAKLGEPDPGSRSQAWEGRRLIRVDGGYIILNYMDYLLKDYGAAERMRRLRARKRADVTVTSDNVTRTVTYPYADSYADEDKKKTLDSLEPERPASKRDPVLVFKTVGKDKEYRLYREQLLTWHEAFPALEVYAQCLKAQSWLEANPTRRKTARGMPRFLYGWLARSQNNGVQS